MATQMHLLLSVVLPVSIAFFELRPNQPSPVECSHVEKSPVEKSPLEKSPVEKSPVEKSPLEKSPAQASSGQKNIPQDFSPAGYSYLTFNGQKLHLAQWRHVVGAQHVQLLPVVPRLLELQRCLQNTSWKVDHEACQSGSLDCALQRRR